MQHSICHFKFCLLSLDSIVNHGRTSKAMVVIESLIKNGLDLNFVSLITIQGQELFQRGCLFEKRLK